MPLSDSLSEVIGRSGIDVRGATVARLGAAMQSGLLTSAELTAFYRARIERLNPELGAVITVSPQARADAQASDGARTARTAGSAPGPLAGIPVLVKDNIDAAAMPATAGSPALAGASSADAFIVSRLRAAGAIVVGKANLSEWANFRSAHSTSGWSTLGGQAVNPHGTGRNPSGSSSGSAVAVSAGLAPLAVGTETDGSIVSPSSACGVVGIKPTVGLVSRSGIVPVSLAQDTAGPMARCVADAAALLSVLAGADPADPATAPAAGHATDFTAFLDPGALAGARLGVWRDGSEPAGPATVAVFDAAIGRLLASGADVIDPVSLADAGKIAEPEFTALLHEFKDDLNAYLAALGGEHPADLTEVIKFNIRKKDHVLAWFGQDRFERADATAGRAGEECATARAQAQRLARSAIDGALAEHGLDAIVALAGGPAWLTDYVLGDRYEFATSTPAAVAGYPAVCVPAGLVSGLPVGVSFIGPAWSEPRLVALAYAFEQAGSMG